MLVMPAVVMPKQVHQRARQQEQEGNRLREVRQMLGHQGRCSRWGLETRMASRR